VNQVDIDIDRVYTPEQEENGSPVARMIVYEACGQNNNQRRYLPP
jgi:hypothetical protein